MTNVSEYLSESLSYLLSSVLVEGVKERIKFEQATGSQQPSSNQNLHLPPSSRRRKGED